jgi:16S rRNA (guanine527-N7)-methyltransferase
VESNAKKGAFLRAAIRETGANATVAPVRIEAYASNMTGRADVVSARALAALPELLPLAAPYLKPGGVMLFLKGQDAVQELDAAFRLWAFDVVSYASVTDSRGCILAIRNVSAKVRP